MEQRTEVIQAHINLGYDTESQYSLGSRRADQTWHLSETSYRKETRALLHIRQNFHMHERLKYQKKSSDLKICRVVNILCVCVWGGGLKNKIQK